MGLLSLFAAALYYHPWLTVALGGVVITLIGVIVRVFRASVVRNDRT
jgi:hypothetical protein